MKERRRRTVRFRHVGVALTWGSTAVEVAILGWAIEHGDVFSTVVCLLGLGILAWGGGIGFSGRRRNTREAKRLYRALEQWIDEHPAGYYTVAEKRVTFEPITSRLAPRLMEMPYGEVDLPREGSPGVATYKIWLLSPDRPTVVVHNDGFRIDEHNEIVEMKPSRGRMRSVLRALRTARANRSLNQASEDELRELLEDLNSAERDHRFD